LEAIEDGFEVFVSDHDKPFVPVSKFPGAAAVRW
jgi:hypothetical protein